MKIGLIDVDGHNFPNLVLMKISAFHKQLGDRVTFVEPFDQYDIVYKSKVFTFSSDYDFIYTTKREVIGGSGYDLSIKLPVEIERMFPDYSIYPQYDYAVGYLTRGCPRNCPFCIVGEKEGHKSVQVGNVTDFWDGQKEIKLLDPNLTASTNRIELFKQLQETGALIDFTQGLDIRFMDDKIIEIIKNMRIKMFHFAYDRMNQKDLIESKLKDFKKKTRLNRSKVSVFVLTNYETTIEEDLYRIMFIRNLNFQPYVMVYNKHKLKRGESIYFKIQRWTNNPRFFWKYETLDDYLMA